MSDDKRLLELAARAAGMPIHVWGQKGQELVADMSNPAGHKLWNPLTDDGDAFRLAVKLRISVEQMAMEVIAYPADGTCAIEPNDDRYAATRRAIVRAAAAIAEGQPS